MTFSMNNFTLTAEAIDLDSIEYVPCEGTIIPIKIDCIEGLRDQLPKRGFGVDYGLNWEKRKIKSVYLFVPEESEEAILCVKYTCDRMEDTQCIHSPQFQITTDEITCLIPDLLAAWKDVEPYNIA